MTRILILFAHPALEKSRVHKQLLRSIPAAPSIRLHDLYEQYPDFLIDVEREQQLLLQHDLIVLQHPFYWYSMPAILKQWMDLVLEHGWAYGTGGTALKGKTMFNAISCGGSEASYLPGGRHEYSVDDFLIPFKQTAKLCHMGYGSPFIVYGTHKLDVTGIQEAAKSYGMWLSEIVEAVKI
ncbi:glutathione-regulated potassium-efflux system oxidoreductase KefF [Flavihumibacter petaseus]|uniref:Glutathione-regulated potassium efflux system ancillary protein KefG n=1 Tax=Flavihumibacter petaseus NBRC 106054 TaxID=1220578 RepID=A0A0E9N298_9BACT|nr:NAD(P)H-dependent oxidoreductase [Flavihumibacter petaseus]GAO43959.1 glutathione-regulated potassium efflux system ancillary protein KefG [Flavihumibacter petaseus NBRC 106054]